MKGSPPGYTQEALAADLADLGIRPGHTILVHASMRSVGQVQGGVTGVIDTLRHLVGQAGTLVVPTGTPDNSDSSRVHLSRIADMSGAQRRRYRVSMPAYDVANTPSTGMGVLAETVRTHPGARRSVHPQSSFAALGAQARQITENHAETCHFGEQSPLARLYDLAAWVLLLGVDYRACSAFHLAEYRYQPHPRTRTYRCVVRRGSQQQWWQYWDVDLDDSDFGKLGMDLDGTRIPLRGTVGKAECRLLPIRSAVDYAVLWLRQHRVTCRVGSQCTTGRPDVILQVNSASRWEPALTTK